MPWGLERRHKTGHLHFLTFSCHHRLPYLNTPAGRAIFEHSLEAARTRYNFVVCGYVVMPEHVHLLLSEPESKPLSSALQAIKLSVSKKLEHRPFWQARYYDFNVYSDSKRQEKLDYMHHNPVKRELVQEPGEWPWSSYTYYQNGHPGVIQITRFEGNPDPP